MNEKFLKTYKPLMDDFVCKLYERDVSDYRGIPHPFLPVWGKKYEKATKKLAFVGIDTRGWGISLEDFLVKYKNNQFHFEDDRVGFQNFAFKNWGTKGMGSFWRFFFDVIAKFHGLNSGKEIQKGHYDYLIDHFVWGNCFAIQTKFSGNLNSNAKGYDYAFEHSSMLNSIDYLENVFSPDIVIIACADCKRYLGKNFVFEKNVDNEVNVYKRNKLVVLQCRHPRYFKGRRKRIQAIVSLLNEYGYFD